MSGTALSRSFLKHQNILWLISLLEPIYYIELKLYLLKELGPILLTFFKLFEILIPKCWPYFSHNPCEILRPKYVLFWRYGWKCVLIMVTIISLIQKRIAALKYIITCKIKNAWTKLVEIWNWDFLVVIFQMKVNDEFWKIGHSSFYQ